MTKMDEAKKQTGPKRKSERYRGILASPILEARLINHPPRPRHSYSRSPEARARLAKFKASNAEASPDIWKVLGVEPPSADALYESEFARLWKPEFAQKFEALFAHFGIRPHDADRWRKLSIKLAIAHVPGCQVRQNLKTGRKPAMTYSKEEELFARFVELKRRLGSARSAAELLAKEIRRAGASQVTGAAILRRLQRFEKKLLPSPKSQKHSPKAP
jgi:hypothetical protein